MLAGDKRAGLPAVGPSARRRVLLACRRALESPRIEDADLAAAAGLLGQLDASDEAVGEGQADQSEMIP